MKFIIINALSWYFPKLMTCMCQATKEYNIYNTSFNWKYNAQFIRLIKFKSNLPYSPIKKNNSTKQDQIKWTTQREHNNIITIDVEYIVNFYWKIIKRFAAAHALLLLHERVEVPQYKLFT